MEQKNEILEILNNHNINGFNFLGGTDKAKDHSYDLFYDNKFKSYREKEGTILEIGVQYGGSSLLWHDYFPKFKIVMTDIRNQVHPVIWEKMEKNRYEYIDMDSFKIQSVELLKSKYPDGFDIIVEDGPHTLESQIFAIKEYSKLLKKGGMLVIEDIQKYEFCDTIVNHINKEDFESVEVVDLRKNKNRYDDILIVVKK